MYFREPLHVRHAVPPRHDEPHRESLIARERIAIQRVGYERFWLHRVFESDAAAELLFEFVGLLAERDVQWSAIGAKADHFPSFGVDSELFQYSAQADASKTATRRQTLHRACAAARALEAVDQFDRFHSSQFRHQRQQARQRRSRAEPGWRRCDWLPLLFFSRPEWHKVPA